MSSVLSELFDFDQVQQDAAVSNALPPPASLMHENPPPANGNNGQPSGSDDDNDDDNDNEGANIGQDTQPLDAQGSSDAVAAFTVTTARNLRLTTDGERSLLQFSQLDTRSALIYQQAMLIKLNETYLRRESLTTSQGPEVSNRLELTDEIKNMIDYRIRLIILSPRLSRYRSLDKGLKTGPGAILVDWLRTKSGINKKYFEGQAYQELRKRVGASCRYARNDLKAVIGNSVKEKVHIAILLRELMQSFEKWFKHDMRTPLALAVRLAFLRQVFCKDPSENYWKTVDETLADIRLKTSSGSGLTASNILVKCLDSDEQKYPPASSSASANTVLASVWQSEIQASMDEFVITSESTPR